MKNHIEPDHKIGDDTLRCFLKNGDGFADEFGKEEVFKKSPQELMKMIAKWKQYALHNFEHLDLDENEQADYAEHHKKSKWRFWKNNQ